MAAESLCMFPAEEVVVAVKRIHMIGKYTLLLLTGQLRHVQEGDELARHVESPL